MKRLVLSALAFSMVAATTVSGMAAPVIAPIAASQHNVVQVDWRKNDHRYDRRHVKKRVERKWRRGEHYRDWRRHEAVRDWHRRGLKRPGRGQEWIRVGNDYLLVGVASGIIGAMVAAGR